MSMYYHFTEGQVYYSNYDSDKNMSFYKDPNVALGYIVEFNNVEKDIAFDILSRDNIEQIDRYTLGSEIQISK